MNDLKKYILVTVLNLLTFSIFSIDAKGQSIEKFYFKDGDLENYDINIQIIHAHAKAHLDTVQFKHLKEYQTEIDKLSKLKTEQLETSFVCKDVSMVSYIQKIYEKLCLRNPSIPKDLLILPVHSLELNASYQGFKTIFINTGLLVQMETEDEIAVILGHEIAHHQLNHFYNDIRQYVFLKNDPEIKKALKSIAKSKSRPMQQFEELKRQVQAVNSQHSRANEQSADSLGYIYASQAGYNTHAFTKAYQALYQDQDELNDSVVIDQILTKYFGENIQPYLKQKSNSLSSMAHSQQEVKPDSLKTHPNLEKRIQYFANKERKEDKSIEKLFIPSQLKKISKVHHLEWLVHPKNPNYSRALYLTLHYLDNKQLDEMEMKELLIYLLKNIAKLSKERKLSTYFHTPNPYFPADYNEMLKIFNRLYTDEMQVIVQKIYQMYYNEISEGLNFKTIINLDDGK